MWKEVLFGVEDWKKLIDEINRIDQVWLFEEQSKKNKAENLKNDLKFFKDNIKEIYTRCLDTDYVRLKQSWVEIKKPSRKNMEEVYIDKIQSIIRTLNLSIKEVQSSDTELTSQENIVIIRPKKIKRVLIILLGIMILNILFAFFKYFTVLVERLQ